MFFDVDVFEMALVEMTLVFLQVLGVAVGVAAVLAAVVVFVVVAVVVPVFVFVVAVDAVDVVQEKWMIVLVVMMVLLAVFLSEH